MISNSFIVSLEEGCLHCMSSLAQIELCPLNACKQPSHERCQCVNLFYESWEVSLLSRCPDLRGLNVYTNTIGRCFIVVKITNCFAFAVCTTVPHSHSLTSSKDGYSGQTDIHWVSQLASPEGHNQSYIPGSIFLLSSLEYLHFLYVNKYKCRNPIEITL